MKRILAALLMVLCFGCCAYAEQKFPFSNIQSILENTSLDSAFCEREDVQREIKTKLMDAKNIDVKEIVKTELYEARGGPQGRFACKVELITGKNDKLNGMVSMKLIEGKGNVLVGWTKDGDSFDENDIRVKQITQEEEKAFKCQALAETIQTIASVWHSGRSPEDSFKIAKISARNREASPHNHAPIMTDEHIKEFVNMVYFDPAFHWIGGFGVWDQVYHSCMNDFKPKYQPLK